MNNTEQKQAVQRYYRWHAAIYDATRWAFLFGRESLLARLAGDGRPVLVEVGCGTGRNLARLAAMHPQWQLTGIDVSADMLHQAAKAIAGVSGRVQLIEMPYGDGALRLPEPADIILFSYSLTMFNPGWEAAIDQARQDLKPGGLIAVVDFHDTKSGALRWWMDRHRVRMDAHLLPYLEQRFEPLIREVHGAWGGWWKYVVFLGQK